MSSIPDPSYAVHRDLLPHIHLLSTYRYTQKAQIQPGEVTAWLMQAPKIARDTAPFFWTYLDKPEHGQIFLAWQPLQLMSTRLSSDGFIWPPQEQVFSQDVGNGIILEMYYHKAGYAPGATFATHSRRRFRLMPSSAPNPNGPQVDPSLWIIHYGPIDNNERIPVQALMRDPLTRDPLMQSILETRAYLQRSGQIQRKEFILGDRVNWPQIGWPKEPARQSVYGQNRGVPQSMAYPPHPPGASGPPTKRPRTHQPAHQMNPMAAMGQTDLEDDEDTSRGDLFDLLTPRDVSISRYKQNHEWMEEILSSAYMMGQIGFADLGLGLRGELSDLTEGIYEAPGANAITHPPTKPATTKLDPEKAAEFRRRVSNKIDSTTAEIERMKTEHTRRMEKFKQNSLLTSAEKDLRTATCGTDTDLLRLESREESEDGAVRWPAKQSRQVDEIVSQVESHMSRQVEPIYDLRRVQPGGYQEPASDPTVQGAGFQPPVGGGHTYSANGSNAMSRQPSQAGSRQSGYSEIDSDIDMGGTAAGLLDQMHTGASSRSTPQAPMSAVPSNVATPANLGMPSPQPPQSYAGAPVQRQSADVRMDGTDAGTGDWVMVPKGGGNRDQSLDNSSAGVPPKPTGPSKPASAAGTPSGFNGDNNDFSSLEDLNSAGEALAGFSGTPGGMSEGMDLAMEDSAFGDAFHGVDTQGGGGTPGDSNM